ncbi:response regulator [Synechococcus sp. PCC 7336]|uniref:response regulator n=1 Tax=Synechococcus sp. PCC 7336 TaxID=195250 RepID=UPI00034D2F11|nr:response regulator [Synechococcus sp. PCC 7336]
MTPPTLSSCHTLREYLEECSRQRFTGVLKVSNHSGCTWALWFFLGRIIGDAGGIDPVGRWLRSLRQQAPALEAGRVDLPVPNTYGEWTHHLLEKLMKRQVVDRTRAVSILRCSIGETLFDIALQEARLNSDCSPFVYRASPQDTLHMEGNFALPLKAEYLWEQVSERVKAWLDSGLEEQSPHQVPIVQNPQQLQELVSEQIFTRLSALLDGKRTIRDVAIALGNDPLHVARALKPQLRMGAIRLADETANPQLGENQRHPAVEEAMAIVSGDSSAPDEAVTELPLPSRPISSHRPAANRPIAKHHAATSRPLIAYIDDSPLDLKRMEACLSSYACDFIGISNPLESLGILLEKRPELIFLDLVMPIANGYEICAQIRRISMLKNIPVTIVTSSDGMVDRIKSKFVGASGFISKPISRVKVAEVLQLYALIPDPGEGKQSVRRNSPILPNPRSRASAVNG